MDNTSTPAVAGGMPVSMRSVGSTTNTGSQGAANTEAHVSPNDKLLSEVARQEKYLQRLPKDFQFPLFNAQQALESQRRSGYRTTAAAAREIVDNAVEAEATKVHVVFERDDERGRDAISAIAFVDNGSGMIPRMIQYALSWGGGTHFDEPDFIGRFGFGLPNASINQTRRVEVYSRTQGHDSFFMSYLDANQFAQHGVQTIPAAQASDLPGFVERYIGRTGIDLTHGTVVVWVAPDRLSYRTPSLMKAHLIDDFGVTYRYLLDKFEIVVEGTKVQMTDPLFLDSRSRLYVPPAAGGANLILDQSIPVKYIQDARTGEMHLSKVIDASELSDAKVQAIGAIHIRVARFPVGFVEGKGKGRRKSGEDVLSDPQRRFEIRKARRGMSFVRAGREIETVDAFPRSQRDIASGLGNWPLLQGYAYHYGVEISFSPELDEVFGITNDKQTVRPIEDFWRVLVGENIDQVLMRENRWQSEERARLRSASIRQGDGPSAAELAAQAADTALGRKPRIPERSRPDAAAKAEQEAKARAELTERSLEEARAAIEQDAKRRPYRVEYVEVQHGPFYEPEWVGTQMVVKINKKHPFFQTLYGTLIDVDGGRLAKEAVDLLLIGLSKGELEATDDEAAEWYRTQREFVWSAFLATGMRTLARADLPTEEETEEAA